MSRKHFKCKGFRYPKVSEKDLASVWHALFLKIADTDYDYDKIVIELGVEYGDLSFLLGSPNDLDLEETPFELDVTISGIANHAKSIEESQLDAFHTKIREWCRSNLRRSWRDARTRKIFCKLKPPYKKLGVYTTDDLHYVHPSQLDWLCGSRINFEKQDFRFVLERFAFLIGEMDPHQVFWCENGKIKNINIFRDEFLDQGIDQIESEFLREFEKVAVCLRGRQLVPQNVFIDSEIHYTPESATRMSRSLGGVPVKKMTPAKKDKLFKKN